MAWLKSTKEKERYYLFAGMGGAASRRRRNIFLFWALVAAAIVSAGMGLLMAFANHIRVG